MGGISTSRLKYALEQLGYTGPGGGGGGGSGAPAHPGPRPGANYNSPVVVNSSTAVAVTAGRLFFQPFLFPGWSPNRLGFSIGVGAGQNAFLSIYANNGGAPGELLYDAGSVATNQSAIVEATLEGFIFPDDYVWAAVVFDGVPNVRVGNPVATHLMGLDSSLTINQRGLFAEYPAQSPAPSQAPAIVGPAANAPMLFFRKEPQ